ncbi:5-formyltetrahydrofolate cyclo-ligase [Platysternon megacephalum]|uniref:5-formyltetrahydrofolate cyclo-ligase n=1 Tax=Platysternon megacephalum TaxID=55544 RepID=A0A4D9ESE6_9SAUR|nr:5-formyltetrahydrofolate cyclo-ligase [Platysternon megacephalum]
MAPEQQRLVKGVTRLQACVRGYLVRKRFQSLQEDYENTVKEIEGDLGQLQWKGRFIPTPVFPQKKQMKVKRLIDQESGSKDHNNTDKGQQKHCPLETLEPEKDCDCRSYMKPTAQLQDEEMVSRGESNRVKQNLECDADKSTGQDCSLSGENTEWKNNSNASSVWSNTVLETGSTVASLELPFKSIKQELPQTLPDLQCYRNHLAMELLWLQQAIVSRKNYLILKQRLGTPER